MHRHGAESPIWCSVAFDLADVANYFVKVAERKSTILVVFKIDNHLLPHFANHSRRYKIALVFLYAIVILIDGRYF